MSFQNINADANPTSGASTSSTDSELNDASRDNHAASGRSQRGKPLVVDTNVREDTAAIPTDEIEHTEVPKEKPVTWMSLPRKDQLLILMFARLSEPLTQTGLGTYIYYQLQSFNPDLPDSTISFQAGAVHAAFPAAQFLTAMLWGRFADSERGGRKRVIWIGLLGTCLSMIGFGFSRSFEVAVLFRCLGGILNGNVGVMRTMISEIVKEKKYQSRAFLILPMTFNVGVIIGPILGGILADPVGSYPSIFGPGSPFGGRDGVHWMIKWPYALPNLLSAVFLLVASLSIFFFLEETSELCKHNFDPGLQAGQWIRKHIFRERSTSGYASIPSSQDEWASAASLELQPTPTDETYSPMQARTPFPKRNKLPFKRVWTTNVIMTLLTHSILSLHVGTFNSLWFTYLSAPRHDPSGPKSSNLAPRNFFHFTGGLALPPARIGLALAILGAIGITIQLFVYPKLAGRLGPVYCLRLFLFMFPATYLLAPFLSIVPSSEKPPAGASGPWIWIAMTFVLFIQTTARTFNMPSMTILVNNCCPHPSVLGTLHGIGQSFSSLFRTIGPICFGWLFGKGLDIGMIGLAWWALACVAMAGSVVGQFLKEGDGHEILLEGEVRGPDGVVRREE